MNPRYKWHESFLRLSVSVTATEKKQPISQLPNELEDQMNLMLLGASKTEPMDSSEQGSPNVLSVTAFMKQTSGTHIFSDQ